MDFLFIGHTHCNTVIQGDALLQYGHVKSNGSKGQGYRGMIYIGLRLHIVGIAVHIIHKVLVLNHNTFGFAGGTRGINAVAQIFRSDVCLRILDIPSFLQKLFQTKDFCRNPAQKLAALAN